MAILAGCSPGSQHSPVEVSWTRARVCVDCGQELAATTAAGGRCPSCHAEWLEGRDAADARLNDRVRLCRGRVGRALVRLRLEADAIAEAAPVSARAIWRLADELQEAYRVSLVEAGRGGWLRAARAYRRDPIAAPVDDDAAQRAEAGR